MDEEVIVLLLAFALLIAGCTQLQPPSQGSKVENLTASTGFCYNENGSAKVDLSLNWSNAMDDNYSLVFNNNEFTISPVKNGNSYTEDLSPTLPSCPILGSENYTILLKTESNGQYYQTEFTSKLNPKQFSYKLYYCGYDYYTGFTSAGCFNDATFIDKNENIDIHGGYINNTAVDWTPIFIKLGDCADCSAPSYIELETSTLSGTQCSIEVYTDPNHIGRFNDKIYPIIPAGQQYVPIAYLKTRDVVDLPISSQVSEGINEFEISPNPNGCELMIRSFKLVTK